MNKQQRYMSLLLLASVVSGAKGMEGGNVSSSVEASGGAAPQLTVDKYAILQPKLSATERQQLEYTVNTLVPSPSRVQIKEAYDAAVQLEIDQAPDARTKDVVQSRKNLWGMLKEASVTDKVDAQIEVNYLSGSEDEEETADEGVKLSRLVSRVHRRDGHLVKQAARLQTLAKDETAVKATAEKQATQMSALLAKKQPLDAENDKLGTQETELTGKQEEIGATQQAVESITDEIVSYIKVEDSVAILRETPREKLLPVLTGELTTEKERLAQELAKIIAAKKVLQDQIAPVASDITKLDGEQQATSAKQTEIAQLISQAQKAESLAKIDREKLLVTIDQRIELQVAQRETLKSDAAALATQVAEEKDAAQKAELQKQKVTKDAEVAAVIQTISNLKIARAQADRTYGSTKWAFGYYNGDK